MIVSSIINSDRQQFQNFDISIIIPTRHRIPQLTRALKSLKQQNKGLSYEIIILIDDCVDTFVFLKQSLSKIQMPTQITFCKRDSTETSGPGRIAKLRNYGISNSKSEWVAFLDDDNEFAPNHLETLMDCVKNSGSLAAYSDTCIYNNDGSKYLEERLPWCRDLNEGVESYWKLVKQGRIRPGTNILKSVLPEKSGDPEESINAVDTGNWLISRAILEKVFFQENYSIEDWTSIRTEDDKLIVDLIQQGCTFCPTHLATLKYYLGGYSNSDLLGLSPGIWIKN